jgi:hypothetical protein
MLFSKYSEYQLCGDHVGPAPILDLKDEDFSLHAELDPHHHQYILQLIFSRFQNVKAVAEMSDAHFELYEILKYNVTIAQLDHDISSTLWEQKKASISEKSRFLADHMDAEIRHMTKVVQGAEEEFQRAMEAVQNVVMIIEEEAKEKQAEALHAYEGAVRNMESELYSFKRVQMQWNHHYQLVCKEEDAQAIEAMDRSSSSFDDAFMEHEHSSDYEISPKVYVPTIEQESSENLVEVDLICTNEAVQQGHTHLPAYRNALKDSKFAENTHHRLEKIHIDNVAAKKLVLDTLTEAVEKAKLEVETTRANKQKMVEIAKKTLHDLQVRRTSELTRLKSKPKSFNKAPNILLTFTPKNDSPLRKPSTNCP